MISHWLGHSVNLKDKSKINLSLLILVCVLTCTISSCSKSEKNPVHVYAYPGTADDIQSPWNLLLSLEVETFEKPLTFSEAKTLDPALRMAARVAESISDENYEFIYDNFYTEDFTKKALSPGFKEIFERSMKNRKDLFRNGKILKRVHLGDRTLLFYSLEDNGKNKITFDRLTIDDKGSVKYLWGLIPTLEGFIIDTLINGKEIIPLPALKEGGNSVRQIPGYRSFSLRYKDFKPTSLPVLHFQGQAHFYKIADARVEHKEEHPVIQFYKEAALSWKSGDLKEIAKHYRAESWGTLEESLQQNQKKAIEYVGGRFNDRSIRYILDADPMYLVFYNPFSRPIPGQSNLYFDYVFKNENGKYQITNFSTTTRMSFLIKKQDFIKKEILPQLSTK